MIQSTVVEESTEYKIIGDEAASDEWVCEGVDGHCEVVDVQELIDVHLVLLNFFLSSLDFIEIAQPEVSIVDEHNGIFLA